MDLHEGEHPPGSLPNPLLMNDQQSVVQVLHIEVSGRIVVHRSQEGVAETWNKHRQLPQDLRRRRKLRSVNIISRAVEVASLPR